MDERRDAVAFFKDISRGMCNGLAYMHDQEYVHRNLTLTSVLVSGKPNLKSHWAPTYTNKTYTEHLF